jgi:hypothetical protein
MLHDRPVTEADDTTTLPDDVRSKAIRLDDGEFMWPFEFARLAVDALLGAGHVIVGVDAREGHDSGPADRGCDQRLQAHRR